MVRIMCVADKSDGAESDHANVRKIGQINVRGDTVVWGETAGQRSLPDSNFLSFNAFQSIFVVVAPRFFCFSYFSMVFEPLTSFVDLCFLVLYAF
jgi:hypothetical protein